MAELKISGRMSVMRLKENFKNEFGGTLRVYDGREKADDNATLASIRRNNEAKGGELVCNGNKTVGNFEKDMLRVFGIKVQVATPDDWTLVLDGITLSKLKDIPEKTSKVDMEQLVAYKRKTKDESVEVEDVEVAESVQEIENIKKSSDLKKFTIKIDTKGAQYIEYCMLDFEDGIDKDEVLDDINYDGLEIVCPEGVSHSEFKSFANCIGDEWESIFRLDVYDENWDLIYETENRYDIRNVSPWIYLECIDDYYESEDEKPDEETAKKISDTMLERAKSDIEPLCEGYCVLIIHETKWQTMEFQIKDNEFSVNKLLFVNNPSLECAGYDAYTDSNHVMYGVDFLEDMRDGEYCIDEYEAHSYLAEIKKFENGNYYFDVIRELKSEE